MRTDDPTSWQEAVIFIAMLVVAAGLLTAFLDYRKSSMRAKQENDLRQLVRRYEQHVENAGDVRQRIAADMAEIRTRTAAIEQILRSVE